MFTTGSKFFFGSAGLFGLIATVYLVGSRSGGEFAGYWTLMSAFFALAFLGSLVVAARDANPNPSQQEAWMATETSGVSVVPRVSQSAWPMVGAISVLVIAIGLVMDRRVFLLGVALAVAATLEWAMQSWADRASDDPAFNSTLRHKIMRPFEVPVFGLIAGAFVVLGFSRVVLAASERGSVVIFGIVAAAVFFGFVLVSYFPKIGRSLIPALVVLGAAGVLTAGIVGAVQGERRFHPETAEDRSGTKTVSNKSGIVATITFQGNTHSVDVQSGGDKLVLPKATSFNILFRNSDSSDHNLVIEDADGKAVATTNFVEQDKATMLTLKINKPGTYRAISEGGAVKPETEIIVQ